VDPDRLPPRTRTNLEKADDLADDIIDIAGLLSSVDFRTFVTLV